MVRRRRAGACRSADAPLTHALMLQCPDRMPFLGHVFSDRPTRPDVSATCTGGKRNRGV